MRIVLPLSRHKPSKGLLPLLLAAAVSQAYADPGDYPDYGADGAADHQSLISSGAGSQYASLNASGGAGETGYWIGGNGGSASAVLDLTAEWQAVGEVSAWGGAGGRPPPENFYWGQYGSGADGSASAVLRGAGAFGSANAHGGDYWNYNPGYPNAGSGYSSLTALTTGAQDVDVAANAYSGYGGGSSTAIVYVDAGVAQPAAGSASVTGTVNAISKAGFTTGDSLATLTLYGTGRVSGTSLAQAADSYNDPYVGGGTAGAATSTVTGITRGGNDVTLSSTARSGSAPFFGAGPAQATVSGQSGSGKVTVTADANSNMTLHQDSLATARATARTTDWGGVSEAYAKAVGDQVSSSAAAYSVGGAATAVAFGSGNGGAVTASSSSGGSSALAAAATGSINSNAFTATAHTAFGGESLALPALGGESQALALVTSGGTAGLGAGVQAFVLNGGNDYMPLHAELSGEHKWQSASSPHLWIDLFGGTSVGTFYEFNFSISNNGTLLFAQNFGSPDEANIFFNHHLLDLGPLAAGAQDLVISSSFTADAGSYGFHYTLAVPEPLEWMLMLSGLTLVMVAARRRSHQQIGGVASRN